MSMREYEAALKLERDRSTEVTLAEYRIVTEATTLCMMYAEDPRLAVLRRLVDQRSEALDLLSKQMQRVVEASRMAREEFHVAEEDSHDLH